MILKPMLSDGKAEETLCDDIHNSVAQALKDAAIVLSRNVIEQNYLEECGSTPKEYEGESQFSALHSSSNMVSVCFPSLSIPFVALLPLVFLAFWWFMSVVCCSWQVLETFLRVAQNSSPPAFLEARKGKRPLSIRSP